MKGLTIFSSFQLFFLGINCISRKKSWEWLKKSYSQRCYSILGPICRSRNFWKFLGRTRLTKGQRVKRTSNLLFFVQLVRMLIWNYPVSRHQNMKTKSILILQIHKFEVKFQETWIVKNGDNVKRTLANELVKNLSLPNFIKFMYTHMSSSLKLVFTSWKN